MNPSVIIIGFTVGLLVGMTGMGGGALMTPLLILTGWARPVMAVGTDLVWGTLTKAVGAFVHRRQGTVNFTIVRRLAMGSIPGAVAGLWVIQKLRHLESGEFVDQLVMRFLGAALMTVAVVMIIRMIRRSDHRRVQDALAGEGGERPSQEGLTVLIGLVIGFLVGVTSVGSGSLIMVALLTLYPRERLRRLVGTDVFHALLLVGTAAAGHWSMGNVDVHLLAGLLIGSVPGVWIGSKATMYMPERALRPVLAVILFGLGYKLI